MSRPPFNQLFLVNRGDPEYFIQRCLESITSLPSIMQEADELDSMRFVSSEESIHAKIKAARLLQLALDLDHGLSAWLAEAQESFAPPMESGTITLQTQQPIEFSPRRLQYESSDAGDIWALYWSMSIYIHELIGQIQARHMALSQELPAAHPLQLEVSGGGKDRVTLDNYAENICGTIFSGLRSCPFTVHGTVIAMFTAQWYYKRHGEGDKLRWCIEALRLLQPETIARGDKENDRSEWGSIIFSTVPSVEE